MQWKFGFKQYEMAKKKKTFVTYTESVTHVMKWALQGKMNWCFLNSLYIIQPSNTTSNIYLIINEWATSFAH